MQIYHFDKKTKEFTFAVLAEADPEETKLKGELVPLVPAYATIIAPPEVKENEAAVFNIKDGKWEIKPDYRKNFKLVTTEFNIQDIKTIGEINDGFVVSNEIAKLIEENPERFKIGNGKVVEKTPAEIEAETAEAERQARITEIKAELEEIDKASQRSSRAISLCILNNKTPNPDDVEKLSEFERLAEALRAELQGLSDEEIPF